MLISGCDEWENDVVLNDVFFNTLSPFQSQLMSTDTIPDYTLKLRKSSPNSIGTQNFNITETFTWPVSDGYNIDIQGRGYAEFLTSLLKFAESYDDSITNIMVRRLVSDSIFEFDKRIKKSQEISEELRYSFKDTVLDTVIPRNSKISDAPGEGKPAALMDITSSGAISYLHLAEEILTSNSNNR